MSTKKNNYQQEIQQMMFVLGEIKEPLDETSLLIEDITRKQIIEIIIKAVRQAQLRNSRFINVEDIIFLIRKNPEKVNRLRVFLSWKDVRKNVKDNKDAPVLDDVVEDLDKDVKFKQKMIKFSWELLSDYMSMMTDEEEKWDENEERAFEEQVMRLKKADDITKNMSKDEYMFYAECRQASFTFKKMKRFRDWCDMQKYYENKINSDVIDILGFLAYESIRSLTEKGLEVKSEWERKGILKNELDSKKLSLFTRLQLDQTPLLPVHIEEAFRRLSQPAPLHLGRLRGYHTQPFPYF